MSLVSTKQCFVTRMDNSGGSAMSHWLTGYYWD